MACTSIILQIVEGVKITDSPTTASNRAIADLVEWIFMKLVIEISADLQVVLAGAQNSSQHRCSTILLVLVNSRSDRCQSFVNQVLYDPIC